MQVLVAVGITAISCAFVFAIAIFIWRLAVLKRKKQLIDRDGFVSVRVKKLLPPLSFVSQQLEVDNRSPTFTSKSDIDDDLSGAHFSGDEDRKRRNTLAQLETVLNLENCDSPTEESSYTSAGDDSFDVLPMSREAPQLEFSLVFASKTNSFNVHIIRAVNLPSKYIRNCSSFTKVTLTQGIKKSVRSTRVFKGSLNPEYEECFSFPGYTLQDIQASYIRFSVYVKGNVLKRFKKVGDVVFHMTEARLLPDEPMIYLERLTFLKRVKRSFNEGSSVTKELGFVFVSLHYQPQAERLKVLIRKAENLPKESGVNIVSSEYYIIVHLMKGIEEVNCKETNSAIGQNPVWNQAFLFNLKPCDLRNYWLHFVVMKGKKYQRHWPLGKFLIGAKTTAAGIAHWNEAMEPRGHETARWHCIL